MWIRQEVEGFDCHVFSYLCGSLLMLLMLLLLLLLLSRFLRVA